MSVCCSHAALGTHNGHETLTRGLTVLAGLLGIVRASYRVNAFDEYIPECEKKKRVGQQLGRVFIEGQSVQRERGEGGKKI
jgi:hypothetical protein